MRQTMRWLLWLCQQNIVHGNVEQCVKMEFEGNTYDVLAGYDEILTLYYGDYMQLPPENQRVTHHIKVVRLNL